MTGITHTLAEVVPGEFVGVLDRHRARCLKCQADDARQRAMARELASLATETVPAPPWFVDAVLADLDHTTRTRRHAALISGIIAGTATVAAGAIAVLARRKLRAV